MDVFAQALFCLHHVFIRATRLDSWLPETLLGTCTLATSIDEASIVVLKLAKID